MLGGWLTILIITAALAARVGSVLGRGDFVAAGSDSAQAAALLDTGFHLIFQKVTLVVIHDPRAGIRTQCSTGR